MKKLILLLFIFINTVAFSQIPTELQAYYSTIDFTKSGTNLSDDLAVLTIAKHTTFLSYTDRHDYLYVADEDENNTNNVILIYSGESRYWEEYLSGSNTYNPQTFNTEHVYPQSLIGSTAKGDLHHLRVCDISINSSRDNLPFGDSSGTYHSNGSSWYPGDEWKGDVARMIMYLNLRYDEPFDDIGGLSLLLKWNVEDPVSNIEKQRNNIIESAQGNRNPFIDNPAIATKIWGGDDAEDTWNIILALENHVLNSFKMYPNPIKGNLLKFEYSKESIIEIFDVLGKKVFNDSINATKNYINISNLNKGIYILKITSDNTSLSKKLIRQ